MATLDPSELGAVGEAKFASLCALAQLVCNQSNRDLTGWDFIVEFPLPPADMNYLDKRQPVACHVQLKSTNGKSGSRVSLRLSAIERLAKDLRPALIVVFRLTPEGDDVMGHVIHLIDDQLARVLKRLRAAHANDQHDINHATITFNYVRDGYPFQLTTEGLRDALLKACGHDPRSYLALKQKQLDELGYEGGRIEAEALIRIEGPDHLRRIALGLSPVRPEKLEVFDRRFGIRVPYKGDLFENIAEFTINLLHLSSCAISIRSRGLSNAAIFHAETFVGPQLFNGEGPTLVFRHPDFVLTFNSSSANFETVGNIDVISRPLSRWLEIFRALTHLASGNSSITVTHTGQSAHLPTISLEVPEPLDGPYIKELPGLTRLLEGWQLLLTRAGVISQSNFTIEEIWQAADVSLAVDLMISNESKSHFEFANFDFDGDPQELTGMYYDNCRLADAAISFCSLIALERTSDTTWPYKSSSFRPFDVRPIVDDLDQYGVARADEAGARVLLDPKKITKMPQSDA